MVRNEKLRPLGRDQINGIEDFPSYAKNWLYLSHSVPTEYFHLHLAEACWLFNHRNEDMKLWLKRHWIARLEQTEDAT